MSDSPSSSAAELEAAKFLTTMFGDDSMLEVVKDGPVFQWIPQRDISVYELALSQYLLGLTYTNCSWRVKQVAFDALPPEVQRHFRVKDQSIQELAADCQALCEALAAQEQADG